MEPGTKLTPKKEKCKSVEVTFSTIAEMSRFFNVDPPLMSTPEHHLFFGSLFLRKKNPSFFAFISIIFTYFLWIIVQHEKFGVYLW
jgi:hypothetical protein